MKALRILFIIAGILAFLEFLFILLTSNTHHGHYMQAILSVALVLYGVFCNRIPKKIHIALWTLCLFPATFCLFLMIYGNRNHVDFSENAVIVLGAGLQGDEVGRHLALRLDTAASYLNQNPDAIVVVSGGLGVGRNVTEAEAMSRYLVRQGIAPERILQEGASTSTYENLTFSNEILLDLFPDGYSAVVVSNDFHIFRATRQARSIGIDATALGAPTPWHTIPANYLREMVAIINFWLFS
jgi:uncharacterized SAM-binding protein YcdF (DUF218 family)